GQDRFRGIQHHSSEHKDGAPYAGKRCVIVGANNSAHDIAADLWENDASVTMIQRSPTLVVKSSALERYGRPLYSEAAVAAGIDADRADLIAASIPYRILPQFAKPTVARIRRDDADFYERLGATGFMLTFGEDESGIGLMYPRRGAGYYID
ncbi:NAD(P)-binding domain-containing protein, partial [Xanthomonas citri pv. citri]